MIKTQQPIDRSWFVKPILWSIQTYARITLFFNVNLNYTVPWNRLQDRACVVDKTQTQYNRSTSNKMYTVLTIIIYSKYFASRIKNVNYQFPKHIYSRNNVWDNGSFSSIQNPQLCLEMTLQLQNTIKYHPEKT